MRFIILGCGSIGQRHLRNILSLGHSAVVQDPDAERLASVTLKYGVPGYSSAEVALSQEAQAVVVCSPSAYHLPQTMEALGQGKHVLVEKPLSHSLSGLDTLISTVDQAGFVVLVGCNMRFCPSLVLAKRLVSEGKVGTPMAARVHGGFYLPSWRPHTDYRQGYGARSELGGGVVLDFSHDLDYLQWFFGEPSEIFCWTSKVSQLEIDTEDLASIMAKFPDGLLAHLQFDYLQPTYRRGMEIIGEEGTLLWDYTASSIHLYGRENNRYQVYLENINTELNSMYVEEMEHFVRCIQGSDTPVVGAREGRSVVELVEAARLSSQQGRVVQLPLEGPR